MIMLIILALDGILVAAIRPREDGMQMDLRSRTLQRLTVEMTTRGVTTRIRTIISTPGVEELTRPRMIILTTMLGVIITVIPPIMIPLRPGVMETQTTISNPTPTRALAGEIRMIKMTEEFQTITGEAQAGAMIRQTIPLEPQAGEMTSLKAKMQEDLQAVEIINKVTMTLEHLQAGALPSRITTAVEITTLRAQPQLGRTISSPAAEVTITMITGAHLQVQLHGEICQLLRALKTTIITTAREEVVVGAMETILAVVETILAADGMLTTQTTNLEVEVEEDGKLVEEVELSLMVDGNWRCSGSMS